MHSVALETQEYATHAPHEHRGTRCNRRVVPRFSGVNSGTLNDEYLDELSGLINRGNHFPEVVAE
jgi:hypothetical protein